MAKQGPIVIVDDDPDDQYLYQRTLEKFNLSNSILFFDNGKDALEYLNETNEDPFLILCDINMPVMTGFEMRERMCSSRSLCMKKTPFIFFSTSSKGYDTEKTSALHIQGIFEKQASFKKHEALLKRIIESHWSVAEASD
jgi:CheY-like chemotaxis protein